MVINHIGTNNSILNKFIAEIRDEAIQKDSLRFRRNIERIGEILGYEFSKSIDYETQAVKTPLGIKNIQIPAKKIVICSILRAGLPLHQGLLNYFDDAENGFISAYRHHPKKDKDFVDFVEGWIAKSSRTTVIFSEMLRCQWFQQIKTNKYFHFQKQDIFSSESIQRI